MSVERIIDGIQGTRWVLQRFMTQPTPKLDAKKRKEVLASLEGWIRDLRVMKRAITRGRRQFEPEDSIALGKNKDLQAWVIRELPKSCWG